MQCYIATQLLVESLKSRYCDLVVSSIRVTLHCLSRLISYTASKDFCQQLLTSNVWRIVDWIDRHCSRWDQYKTMETALAVIFVFVSLIKNSSKQLDNDINHDSHYASKSLNNNSVYLKKFIQNQWTTVNWKDTRAITLYMYMCKHKAWVIWRYVLLSPLKSS